MAKLPGVPAGMYLTVSCAVQCVGLLAFAAVSNLETLCVAFVPHPMHA
jgi:hypothetical protein